MLSSSPPPPEVDPPSSASSTAERKTSAVTRQWSDINPRTLLTTFGAASFAYSLVTHPLYLIVARQQCVAEHPSVRSVARTVWRNTGPRGFFRGCGLSVTGTVLSESIYYVVLEYSKEHLPFERKPARDFGAGLCADGVSGPLFVPFAVISQRQMTADIALTTQPFQSALATTRALVRSDGYAALLRGTLLSLSMMPISGAWWVVYEQLKAAAYAAISHWEAPTDGSKLSQALTSSTDNPAVNAVVGAMAGAAITIALNPLYVVRTRVQVMSFDASVRNRFAHVVRDILRRDGLRGFSRGLAVNLAMGVSGGFCFGPIYEGTKQIADISAA